MLIVNLYAGNDGYSLMLKKKDNTEVETVKLPYEVSFLFCFEVNLMAALHEDF